VSIVTELRHDLRGMTLFEYIAVAVSIVLSFGAVRLLDGLPHMAFTAGLVLVTTALGLGIL
jgi:hypothetical protein